jgi:hypothetical protein
MAIDPVKIPQNVYIEDRIVGPLTLRQIIIMTLGGGFSYMLYSAVSKSLGSVGIPLTILLWTPAAIAAAFAMIQVNDLSLLRICMLAIERLNKPSKRTFTQRQGISIVFRTGSSSAAAQPEEKVTDASAIAAPTVSTTSDQIRALSTVVDTEKKEAETASQETKPPLPSPAPSAPVDRSVIQTDTPAVASERSNLAVFRDVFPPHATWQ